MADLRGEAGANPAAGKVWPADALPLYAHVDAYEITGFLGHGGLGMTYAARHRLVGRRVAIKECFSRQYARRMSDGSVRWVDGTDADGRHVAPEWLRKIMLREARAIAGELNHPNIVAGENYIEANGTFYLVMRYVDGENLQEWLQRQRTLPSETLLRQIFESIFEGIDYLHESGFVHRDLKPSNLMIQRGGQPIVIDLGASGQGLDKARSDTSVRQRSDQYAAPEQWADEQHGRRDIHGRYTDGFALGGVLYRCIAGHPPQPNAADRQFAMTQEGGEDPYLPAAKAARQPRLYSAAFLTGIDRALKIPTSERPQSILQLREALGWAADKPRPADIGRPVQPPRRWGLAATAMVSAMTAGAALAISVDVGGYAPWRPAPTSAACAAAEQHWQRVEAARFVGAVLAHLKRFTACQTMPRALALLEAAASTKIRPADASPAVPAPDGQQRADCAAQLVRVAGGQWICAAQGAIFQDCEGFCPEMAVIPAGTFVMGLADVRWGAQDDAWRPHPVAIEKPFALGRFELTVAEWAACVAAEACRPADTEGMPERLPAINVSARDAQDYLTWLNRILFHRTDGPYRLPSEAEWEYAARGGTDRPFVTGVTLPPDAANYDWRLSAPDARLKGKEPPGRPVAVGTYPENPFKLFDMQGNVWEWVADCWTATYAGARPASGTGVTASCDPRVVRGGGWKDPVEKLNPGYRERAAPTTRNELIGFRVARTLD